MSTESILGLKGLQAKLDEFQALVQPVGAEPALPPLQIAVATAKDTKLAVFGEDLGVNAALALQAHIHPAAFRAPALTMDGTTFEAPTDHHWLDLGLTAKLGLTGNASTSIAQAALSGKLAADAEYIYRQLLPVAKTEKRIDALVRALRATRLPHRLDLDAVPEDSVSEESLRLAFDLGLEVSTARKFAVEESDKVFHDLPAGFKLAGQAALSASLGFALLGQFKVLVGRGKAVGAEPGAVRIRVERVHRSQLNLGAQLAIEAHYEVTGLQQIVEAVFAELPPVPRAAEYLEQVAAGDWDSLKAKASEKLGEFLSDWLEDTGWKEKAAGDPSVVELLATAKKVTDAWQNLPKEIQSFWGSLLGRVGAEAIAEDLERISKLEKVDDLLALFTGDAKKAAALTDLIELLHGQGLEDLLASAETALAKVRAKAGQALNFLRGPGEAEIAKKLQDFAERTGIGKVLAALGNLTSLDTLEGWLRERVKKLAEKLTGKAWATLAVDPAALAKVQARAKELHQALIAGVQLKQKLVDLAGKLKGDFGFSLGLEFERITSSSALIDFDLEAGASDSLRDSIGEALREGDVAGMLERLDAKVRESAEEEAHAPGGLPENLPFRLRECLFLSSAKRTAAAKTIFSLTGLGRFVNRGAKTTIEERSLVFSPAGRRGRWSGGILRSQEASEITNQLALWLDVEDGDGSLSLTQPFASAAQPVAGLRVRYQLDGKPGKQLGAESVAQLLGQLGFEEQAIPAFPDGGGVRLTLGFDFSGEALETLLSDDDEAKWDRHYRIAGGRWFDERILAVPNTAFAASQGKVIAALMAEPEFRDHWREGSRELVREFSSANGLKELEVGDRTKPTKVRKPGTEFFHQAFWPLAAFVNGRRPGLEGQERLKQELDAALASRRDAAYSGLSRTFTRRIAPWLVSDNNWPSTLFGLYLLIERLRNQDKDPLAKVTGFASLRVQKAGEEWGPPSAFRLHRLN